MQLGELREQGVGIPVWYKDKAGIEVWGNSPPADIQVKFYGDRPRETPPSGGGGLNIAILDLSKAISRKRCKIGSKLVVITNSKSHISFQLVPN